MTPIEQQKIFLHLARSGPGYIGWKKPGEKFKQGWFASSPEALALIGQHSADSNVFVSMATYPNRNLDRSAKGAEHFSSYWLDVDAHEDDKYIDSVAVLGGLMKFVAVTCLPKPSIIHLTGHGIHLLWSFEKPISKDYWLPRATKLQQLADYHQLGADSITADAARILRVPGTHNFRDPCDPKPAIMHVFGDGYVDANLLKVALDNAYAKLPSGALNQQRSKPNTTTASTNRCLTTLRRELDTPRRRVMLATKLAHISAKCGYARYRDVVWAILSTSWPDAPQLAEEWCKSAPHMFDQESYDQVIKSYDPTRPDSPTLGTITYLAREGGWNG